LSNMPILNPNSWCLRTRCLSSKALREELSMVGYRKEDETLVVGISKKGHSISQRQRRRYNQYFMIQSRNMNDICCF
jgi:hypothetical protein